jgi:hypothetical protein
MPPRGAVPRPKPAEGEFAMLRTLLMVRAAFNLVFGIVVLVWMEHAALRGIGGTGFYMLVDGALTLAIAFALPPGRRRWLAVLTAADGLLRLGVAAFIYANPGLEQMAMTTAFFLTAASVGFIVLGMLGLVAALLGARQAAAAGAPVWPPVAITLCTLLLGLGIALSFFDQQLRAIIAVYAIVVGVLLGYAAWRLGPAAAQVRPAGVAR